MIALYACDIPRKFARAAPVECVGTWHVGKHLTIGARIARAWDWPEYVWCCRIKDALVVSPEPFPVDCGRCRVTQWYRFCVPVAQRAGLTGGLMHRSYQQGFCIFRPRSQPQTEARR